MSSQPQQAHGRLGRYELLARLATGGMGEIFLARLEGAAGFEKIYVIKRVLPHLADDARFRAMLIDEARIAAKMSHPHICQVYELGEDAGQLFIAMEYLEGVTLLPVLRRAARAKMPLAAGLVATVLQQTCDALHYAHELNDRDGTRLGVVHRDVTPSNLFLTETGIIKVLDFGIAKAKDASAHTQDGTVKGKYAYMAPEQLRSETTDRRVDIFSLAVVGFEMLALRRLFQRKTDYLTFRAVMELPIPMLREFRPELPSAVVDVFARALDRDPKNRFATARQFASALQDALDGFAKPWSTSELGDFIRQNFADELRRRGSDVSTVIESRESPSGAGRPQMPVLAPIDSEASARADVDEDDFPSIETGAEIHDLELMDRLGHATPTGEDGHYRVDTGSEATGRSLTELAPAPALSRPRMKRESMSSVPAPAAPHRRSLMLPLIALAIVGAGGIALFVMWREMRSHSQQPQTFIIQQGGASIDGSGSSRAIGETPGSAAGSDSGSDSGSGSGSDSVAAKPPAPDSGDKPRIPTGDDAILAQLQARLRSKQDAINRCAANNQAVVESSKGDLRLRVVVDTGGRGKSSVLPEWANKTPLGNCLRAVADKIDYGKIGKPLAFSAPLVAK